MSLAQSGGKAPKKGLASPRSAAFAWDGGHKTKRLPDPAGHVPPVGSSRRTMLTSRLRPSWHRSRGRLPGESRADYRYVFLTPPQVVGSTGTAFSTVTLALS
jgi:hypothetical protein